MISGKKRLRYCVKFILDTVGQILSESAEVYGGYDKNTASVTHIAMKLVCLTKFTHSRVE